MLLGFGAAGVVVLTTIALALSSLEQNRAERQSVARLSDVVVGLDDTLVAVHEVESGMRGFVITGRKEYLDLYEAGIAETDRRLVLLRALVADDPAQVAHVALLERQVAERVDLARARVATRQRSGLEVAAQEALTMQGKEAMDAIRRTIAEAREDELRRRARREDDLARSDHAVFATLLALAATLAVGIAVTLVVLRRDLSRRARSEARLKDLNAELHRARDALFQKNREIRVFFDGAPDCIASIDRDLRFHYVNAALERAIGMPASVLAGRTYREIGLPEVAEWDAALRTVFETGEPRQVDIRTGPGWGSLIYSVSLVALRDVGGSVDQVLAVGRDVTDFRKATERLRRAEERLELAVRNANAGIWDRRVGEPEGYYSPLCAEMLGYDPDEYLKLAGRRDLLVHPDDVGRVVAAFEDHAAGRTEIYDIEYRVREKAGTYRWVHDRGRIQRNGAGDAVRFTGSRTDIDARKRLEADLEASRVALAARVDQLEAALAEVRELRGILPICCYCKNVREDENYWTQVEEYVSKHTAAQFSHGICPSCYQREIVPQLEARHTNRQPRVD
jgi:PAS domain S-box-containing protein